MKLSDIQIESKFLSNGPWYSLLAIYMPMSIIITLGFLIETIIPSLLPLTLLIICSVLSALAASLYCGFMKDTMYSRIAANIRGGIIILAVSYIVSSLFHQGFSLKERFIPNRFNIFVPIGALYAWIVVISLKQLFNSCIRLEAYTKLYRGEKLQRMILEDSSLLQYTDEKIIKTGWNYLYQLIFVFIITVFCVIFIKLPLALYIMLVVILTGGICIFGFLGIIRQEQYYAGEGVGFSAHERAKRILAIAAFSLLCFTAAIFPVSDKNILPFSAVTGFLKWFISLFSFLNKNTPPANTATITGMENPIPYSPLDEIAPSPFWEQFWEYGTIIIKFGLIILAAAGFITFMISPLLSRFKIMSELTFRQKLKKIITEWYKSILTAFASFFAYLKNGKNSSKLNKKKSEEIRRTAATIFGAYSPAKKRDMRRSVTLFARLIIWGGQTRHVMWKPSLAPGEYCGILALSENIQNIAPDDNRAAQMLNEKIIRCGELFEKALYSADVLSETEKKEFKSNVEEITASDA